MGSTHYSGVYWDRNQIYRLSLNSMRDYDSTNLCFSWGKRVFRVSKRVWKGKRKWFRAVWKRGKKCKSEGKLKNYTILSNKKWEDLGKKNGENEKVHERKQTGKKINTFEKPACQTFILYCPWDFTSSVWDFAACGLFLLHSSFPEPCSKLPLYLQRWATRTTNVLAYKVITVQRAPDS